MLRAFPQTGALCEMKSRRLVQVRRFPVTLPFGNWIVIYQVHSDYIVILRFLHGSQDWKKLFP